MKQVSVAEAKEVIERGGNTRIIDVRSPAEFRGSHIAEAENVPLDQISGESLDLKAEKGDRIFLICQSGVRSAKASEKLRSLGYSEAVSIEGGMNAWEARGYGAEKGKKTISIERQVRIAAGSLVVVGGDSGRFGQFVVCRNLSVRRCRARLCGSDRHLWNGDDALPHALESVIPSGKRGFAKLRCNKVSITSDLPFFYAR